MDWHQFHQSFVGRYGQGGSRISCRNCRILSWLLSDLLLHQAVHWWRSAGDLWPLKILKKLSNNYLPIGQWREVSFWSRTCFVIFSKLDSRITESSSLIWRRSTDFAVFFEISTCWPYLSSGISITLLSFITSWIMRIRDKCGSLDFPNFCFRIEKSHDLLSHIFCPFFRVFSGCKNMSKSSPQSLNCSFIFS